MSEQNNQQREYLRGASPEYLPDHGTEQLGQNSTRPAMSTLFSEFVQMSRRVSPSTQSSSRQRSSSPPTRSSPRRASTQPMPTQYFKPQIPTIDLRSLDYASHYDPNLMCPICHIPFINPVVLDCDHTFCASCLDEHTRGLGYGGRSQCPSCRIPIASSPRKASRLIYNMCNDIVVSCPNEGCTMFLFRGHIEVHARRDCPEQILPCPDVRCEKETKRKNYVPQQCVHSNSVECDCGMVIELGQGEWLRHKDEVCPNTGTNCGTCGERTSIKHQSLKDHKCRPPLTEERCPGEEYGCTDQVSERDLRDHITACPLARLAPHLKAQSRLLQTMQDQLTAARYRNENLEIELERVNSTLTYQIQPRIDQLPHVHNHSDTDPDDHIHDHDNDIEEIPRDSIPSAAAIHHRDLLLPAHIRDLTPSPDLLPTGHPYPQNYMQNQAHMHNHLLSLHEALRNTVSHLEADVNSLQHSLAELDARSSMQLMNETLRLREELAHAHAALMSNRSQVQWLLNRERVGREQAILRNRGQNVEQYHQTQTQNQGIGEAEAEGNGTTQQTHAASDTFPFPSPGAGMTRTLSGSGTGSAPSSTATSPMFSGIGLAGRSGSTRRPSIRTGSQERVKL